MNSNFAISVRKVLSSLRIAMLFASCFVLCFTVQNSFAEKIQKVPKNLERQPMLFRYSMTDSQDRKELGKQHALFTTISKQISRTIRLSKLAFNPFFSLLHNSKSVLLNKLALSTSNLLCCRLCG